MRKNLRLRIIQNELYIIIITHLQQNYDFEYEKKGFLFLFKREITFPLLVKRKDFAYLDRHLLNLQNTNFLEGNF